MNDRHKHKAPPLNLSKDFQKHSLKDWREVVDKDLKGASFEKKLVWNSPDGPVVNPIYTKEDLESLEYKDQLPGFAPYKRGSWPLSGVKPPWQIRQDCVLPSPEETNTFIRNGLAHGQTAVGLQLDQAARKGLDGDSPDAQTLAGVDGCTITTVHGLRIALANIDLNRSPITINSGTSSIATLGFLMALLEERGDDPQLLSGGLDCDPVSELLSTGTVRGGLDLQWIEMSVMVRYCAEKSPAFRPVSVNSKTFSEAGSSIVYELAATISAGVEYLRQMMKNGIEPNVAAQSIVFNFSITPNMFLEVSKLRAARILWAKVTKAFNVTDESAGRMFMHVRTSSFAKTNHEVHNNIVRSSIEAFASAIGGCDSMYVSPFDETLGNPDEFSSRVARNQQILLQEEAHLNKVVDPAGGSYFVESMTDNIGREAWKEFQKIEAEGGIIESIISGSLQQQTKDDQSKKQKLISSRRSPIVGVSNYVAENSSVKNKCYSPDGKFLETRRRRIQRIKSVRKNTKVQKLLEEISESIDSKNNNTIEAVVEASKEGATIQEISNALTKNSASEPISVEPLHFQRASVPFENLRAEAKKIETETGSLPKAVLVLFGSPAFRRARADFCLNFFRAGGFKVVELEPVENLDQDIVELALSNSRLIVTCSDDDSYPEKVPEFAKSLKKLEPSCHLIVAGNPASADELKAAGVDDFVHLKSDAILTLQRLMKHAASNGKVSS